MVLFFFDFFGFLAALFEYCLLFLDDLFELFLGSGGNCTFGNTDSMTSLVESSPRVKMGVLDCLGDEDARGDGLSMK